MKVCPKPLIEIRLRRIVAAFALSAAFAFIGSSCASFAQGSPSDPPGEPRIGAQAPDFSLQDLQGKKVSLRDFKGRPVMLNFWASWCGPCKIEMPHMQAAQEELRESTGFVVLAVNLGEDKATAERFINENRFDFVVVLDQDQAVAQNKYRLIGLPTSFFIDKGGVIRDIQTGPLATKEHLMSKIRSIL